MNEITLSSDDVISRKFYHQKKEKKHTANCGMNHFYLIGERKIVHTHTRIGRRIEEIYVKNFIHKKAQIIAAK